MADWRQIQARIRKAKNSADAPTKLSELYQRTRDAMVAWELALIEEKAERMAEAGKWYQIAAQRFRRADWKKKAEEALARLGIELPTTPVEEPASPLRSVLDLLVTGTERASEKTEFAEIGESQMPLALGEIPEHAEATTNLLPTLPSPTPNPSPTILNQWKHLPLHRAPHRASPRRQPRPPRKSGAEGVAVDADVVAVPQQRPGFPQNLLRRLWSRWFRGLVLRLNSPGHPLIRRFRFAVPRRWKCPPRAPQLPSERTAHGRAGDPALASRMAHLESMLRRLVASPLHRLEEADTAPAGPGVFLLSDSDQISSYYVEACQTLRVGIGNLARGGRSGKPASGRGYSTETGLKSKLAEHLGINEGKVSQYMKDHCVVRWIQLDDDAPLLAHFAIGVLRTPLNLD